MKPSAFILVLANLLFLQTLSLSSIAAGSPQELCSQLQGYYIDPPSCIASLSSDPKSRTGDDSELAVISVDLLIANASNVLSEVEQLLKEASDAATRKALQSCGKHYEQGIPGLKSARDASAAGKYGDAARACLAFRDAPFACDDEFEANGIKNPLDDVVVFFPIHLAYAVNDYVSHAR